MSTVLVTGGAGTLGSALVPLLVERGHDVRSLSRRVGAATHVGDLQSGAGLAEAATGAELVVHAASDRRMGRSDVVQTRNLLDAVSGCRHLVYISIVGIDQIPYRLYRRKLECEQMIEASAVPSTTLRATQFHELLALGLGALARLPVVALPLASKFQPVAASEVAARLADIVEGEPLGRAPDFGGPEVLSGRQIVDVWHSRRRRPRVVPLRLPGRVMRGFTEGLNTCPDHLDGRQTWQQFVQEHLPAN